MKRVWPVMLLIALLLVAQKLECQGIEVRFYPEKQTYLVGEPIVVILDLEDTGAAPVYISVTCPWLDTRFEAPTVPRLRAMVSLFGCGVGGSFGDCAGGAREILPWQHYYRRYLLDGDFRLDPPGVYVIKAWHKVDLYANDTTFRVVASQDVVSGFQITLIDGDKEKLASASQPLLGDLKASAFGASSLTVRAIVQNLPHFLEGVILAMANDPHTVAASIPGLKRLATPRAKAKLAELSGPGNPEYVRQPAIEALGELGDPSYCSLVLGIARRSHAYSRFIALRAGGYLCGVGIIPLAWNFLTEQDLSARFEAAYALGNTHSRGAVQPSIPLLRDQDRNMRRAASDALASLTHRASNAEICDETATEETYTQ